MSDKLFSLIQSLSKQEKRYFKLFAGGNREASNYVKLFDTLCKQKVYEEVAIKEIYKKEKFIKQLHVTKNYLYKLILRSLHIYHINISEDSIIKELLQCVEILYNKGLYGQCTVLLNKAKKIALKKEFQISLIEIIEWESKIAFIDTNVNDLENYVNKGYLEELEFHKILKNKRDFRKLFYEILILNNKGIPIRSKRDLDKYEIIINNPILSSETQATSYYSKIMYNYIYAYYLLNKGDIFKSNRYNIKIVELMEANPLHIKNTPINYVAALNNFIYASIQLKKIKQSSLAILKLRNIPEKYNLSNDLSADLKDKIFIRSYFLESELYKESGEFEKAIILINELQTRINYFNSIPISRYKIFLMYNISYIYFALGNYSKALFWINKVLNITETKEPVDIFCFARIINLLIHYELKNFEVIDYIYKSNIRFFNKRNRLYKLEVMIFDFVKQKMLKETSRKKLIKDFALLKKELLKITVSPQDKKALQYFDYIAWVDSKIKNVSLADVIMKKLYI